MEGMKMRRITLITASLVTAIILAGCSNVNVTVNTGKAASEQDRSNPDETEIPAEPETQAENRQTVAGSYGQLSNNNIKIIV